MKKLVLTTVCALAVTGAAFAAGNVSWTGPSAAFITAQTNSTAYSPLLGGGATGSGAVGVTSGAGVNPAGYYYELLYTTYSGTQATIPSLSALLAWNDTGLSATNGNTAGRLADVNPNAGAQVPWSPGTTDSIVLVGWSADLGTTWGVVSNELATGSYKTVLGSNLGFLGVSTTGFITPFDTSTSPGSGVFGNGDVGQGTPIFSTNTQLFLLPVPEPTTLALAGLGGLSLLLFRRQRK
jgi:hypothetical protein